MGKRSREAAEGGVTDDRKVKKIRKDKDDVEAKTVAVNGTDEKAKKREEKQEFKQKMRAERKERKEEKKMKKRLRLLKKDIRALPEGDQEMEDGVEGTITDEKVEKVKEKKKDKYSKEGRKSKKEKKDKTNGEKVEGGEVLEVDEEKASDEAKAGDGEKLSKKAEKKKKKREAEAAKKLEEEQQKEAHTTPGSETRDNVTENGAAEGAEDEPMDVDGEQDQGQENGKKHRFIVFVGNLPYSATQESIQAHFATFRPTSVRCLSDREDPTKCRGCGFVEFSNAKVMKTCLEKWHHSTFNDGISKPRKINVELTAGGGGHKANRMDKIKKKNDVLNMQRARQTQERKDAKHAKEAKKEESGGVEDSMHPSRRARMPANGR